MTPRALVWREVESAARLVAAVDEAAYAAHGAVMNARRGGDAQQCVSWALEAVRAAKRAGWAFGAIELALEAVNKLSGGVEAHAAREAIAAALSEASPIADKARDAARELLRWIGDTFGADAARDVQDDARKVAA